ncbi:MAG: Myo-inositol 2-dehydrogenase [Candidatus Moanabacter tarae]|uniref:Myo-inositol 2-dehydrogenase n=1 Tax=Candidatus Moanibacter tarae TaxID=2200854 RepID=A0A2Z4AHM9_9BACT|nr:MAG: Myo-inositol 2-dehydrogenase [Candidatus Moanabacter tarae]|tara:strand:- start:9589 stop:10671 length:1083 start_codon:yes stop_codon:yes gene_type:complete
MKNYRLGIIGLGRMGSTIDDEGHGRDPYSIAASCQAIECLTLAAGADLRAERREAFRDRWGVKALYEDYMEMVEKEKPDLVAVCTTASGLQKPINKAPDSTFRGDSHAELTIALANAGVPMLYVEKAMASSLEQADLILNAIKKNKTVINTGVLRRFDESYDAVRDAISSGEIGEPRAVIHFAPSSLMHGHIHSIDTVSFLLGDPKITAVRGELLPRDLEIKGCHLSQDPNAIYQLRFENGVEVSSIAAGEWEFEVVGTAGSIRSINNGNGTILRKPGSMVGRRQSWEEVPFPPKSPKSPVVSCLEDILSAFSSGGPTLGHIDCAHHITEACFAVAESHRKGGTWVDLPLLERGLYIFHV